MSSKSQKVLKERGMSPLVVPEGNANKREAHQLVTSLKFAQRSTGYLFRGIDDYSYDVIPSISRKRADGKQFNIKDEKIIFRSIKNEGLEFIEKKDFTDIDFLAMAQHFGAPTRLLDWTTNPLVALYFSIFSGRKIDEERDGVVYIYNSQTNEFIRRRYDLNTEDNEIPMFPKGLFTGKVRFIMPKFTDIRIKNQNGLFSVQEKPEISFFENCNKERLSFLVIPSHVKTTLARYLYGLGITHDFIMPGLDGFCQTLSYRYHYNVGIRSHHLESEEYSDEEQIEYA